MAVTDFKHQGRTVVQLVAVEQLGNAWSGGLDSQRFGDGRGPDAGRLAWASAHGSSRPWPDRVRQRTDVALTIGDKQSLPISQALWLERRPRMNTLKLAGIALIVLGVLGIAYGGFSYTRDTRAVKFGPLELTVKERKRVNVPVWAGAGALAAGVWLLVVAGSRKS